MKASCLLLQQGAARGLTLAQIGKILCRPDDDDCEPSTLEKIVKKAEQEQPKAAPMRKPQSTNSFASLLGQALADQQMPTQAKRTRLMTEEVSLEQRQEDLMVLDSTRNIQIQIDNLETDDVESMRSFAADPREETKEAPVAPQNKAQLSFGAACKQQAKEASWTRLNLAKEEPTAEERRKQQATSRLSQKGGPLDTEFFGRFSTYLDDAISEVLGEDIMSQQTRSSDF